MSHAEKSSESSGAARGHAGGAAATVIPAVYAFLGWMAPKVGSFPRVHRFTVGDRVMSSLLDLLDALIMAQYEPQERQRALRSANLCLERLRYLVRLAKDLQCLSLKEYEHSARHMVDIGRQIGGWARHARAARGGHPSSSER